MPGSASIGSLVYHIVADTTKSTSGLISTKKELALLKKVILDTGTTLERMASQDFHRLTLVARDAGKGLDVASRGFGKLAAKSREAKDAAKEYVAQLRLIAQQTRAGAKGRPLSDAERNKVVQLERTADAFERQIAIQRNLRAEELRTVAARRRSTRSIKQQEAAVKRLNGTGLGGFATWAKSIFGVTLAYKALRIAQDSLRKSLELGREEKAFEIFTGSAQRAEMLVEQLRNLAATTPLVLSSTMQATRTLLQYGVAGGIVVERLRQLGDVAGGSHERLQRLALAFGQITANGRLQGQELRQLIESGFNPLQVISERTGESMLSLRNKMADGMISIKDVTQALKDATSEGGRFNNQMNRIAKETPFGQIQLLLGQLEIMAVDVAESWAEAFGGIAKELRWIVEQMNKIRGERRSALSVATAEERGQLESSLGSKLLDRTGIGFLKNVFESFYGPISMEEERLIHQLARRKQWMAEINEEKLKEKEAAEAQARVEATRLGQLDEIVQRVRNERRELEGISDYEKLRLEIVRLLGTELSEQEEQAVRYLLMQQKMLDAEKKRQEQAKKAQEEKERREKESDKAIDKAMKKRADMAKRIIERQMTDQERLAQQLAEVRALESVGALDPAAARRERRRLIADFEEQEEARQLEKFGRGEREAAAVASKRSVEEFNIMRQISQQNKMDETREEARHKAEQEKREAIKMAIKALPGEISKLMPELM